MIYIIEGKDGIGKTTLINNIRKHFKSNNINHVKFYREPGGTLFSEQCREILLNYDTKDSSALTTVLLILSARSDLYDSIIEDVNKGFDIIVDRGILSTYIYQHEVLINNKKLRDITLSIQPKLNTDVIYLDGIQKNIDRRTDNNWMDNTYFKHLEGIELFIDDIKTEKHITFNRLDISNYDEQKMLNIFLRYMKQK